MSDESEVLAAGAGCLAMVIAGVFGFLWVFVLPVVGLIYLCGGFR